MVVLLILLVCLVVFVLGLLLRSIGLGMERRAHMQMMEMEHEARWRDASPRS